jgi:predicted RNase H-like HicB family nuclease
MEVSLQIHLEASEQGTPVWWVESEELPGFTASADSLVELRAVVSETLQEFASELLAESGDGSAQIEVVSERLVVSGVPTTVPDAPTAQVEDRPVEERRSPLQVLVAA